MDCVGIRDRRHGAVSGLPQSSSEVELELLSEARDHRSLPTAPCAWR